MIDHDDNHQWAEFLDRLVHDLREPLRSVNAYSELLAEMAKGSLGTEGDMVLGEISTGAARMRVMLESLAGYSLALRAASSAPGSSANTQTSLQSAFNIVVLELDAQIQASGATVTADGLPRINLALEQAMQLLENLIGNSLRFRSEASPVILVSAAPGDGGLWEIRVEDNGIGLAPDCWEAVFKPFMRVEGRKYGGVGLGLSICRKIVEAHGGTIRMEGALGQGAICTLTLPGQ